CLELNHFILNRQMTEGRFQVSSLLCNPRLLETNGDALPKSKKGAIPATTAVVRPPNLPQRLTK
ncbi:MAG: hypothetical protein ACKO0V_12565, partial [bacterium]